MLSRVAEALFWIGRYVERAEDTARLLDVHFHEVLEDPGVDEAGRLRRAVGRDGGTRRHRAAAPGQPAVLELLGYDDDHAQLDRRRAGRRPAERPRRTGGALGGDLGVPELHPQLACRRWWPAARDFGPAPFFSYVRERAATFAGHVEAEHEPGRESRRASFSAAAWSGWT
jgi:hypothetical protein